MQVEKCEKVLDILDMYRVIKFENERLQEQEHIKDPWVKFQGFDGNNESEYSCYASYFVKKLGRFSELLEDDPEAQFDSHMPTLRKYNSMLSEWKKLENRFELSKKDILTILNSD